MKKKGLSVFYGIRRRINKSIQRLFKVIGIKTT